MFAKLDVVFLATPVAVDLPTIHILSLRSSFAWGYLLRETSLQVVVLHNIHTSSLDRYE